VRAAPSLLVGIDRLAGVLRLASLLQARVGAGGERDRQEKGEPADGKVGGPAQAGAAALNRVGSLQRGDDGEPERNADRQTAGDVGRQQRLSPRLGEQDHDRRQQRRIERRVEGEHEKPPLHSANVSSRSPRRILRTGERRPVIRFG
jgi:hypothetical protein